MRGHSVVDLSPMVKESSKARLAGYGRDPAQRELGFALTALPIVALLVGALIGVARSVSA